MKTKMKWSSLTLFVLSGFTLMFTPNLEAKSEAKKADLAPKEISTPNKTTIIRANLMTPKKWKEMIKKTNQSFILEFKMGDQIPIRFIARGDLIESDPFHPVQYDLRVKRDFLLQVRNNQFFISFDGIYFFPFKDVMRGSWALSANTWDGTAIVNGLELAFDAWIK